MTVTCINCELLNVEEFYCYAELTAVHAWLETSEFKKNKRIGFLI